jgi:hypothetical protein
MLNHSHRCRGPAASARALVRTAHTPPPPPPPAICLLNPRPSLRPQGTYKLGVTPAATLSATGTASKAASGLTVNLPTTAVNVDPPTKTVTVEGQKQGA